MSNWGAKRPKLMNKLYSHASSVSANNSTRIALALLILVPIFVNFFVPIYNYTSPKLGGLPFFYWFQTLLLVLSSIPYLVFSYIERRTSPEVSGMRAVK